MYCFWIFISISCIVGGLAIFQQDLAVKGLSNAALLLSIVLAVIAILITLWDVAGQKNNISDLKKSVEELGGVTKGLEELTSVSLKTIDENQTNLSLISNQLIEAVKVINSATPDEKYSDLEKQITGIDNYLRKSKLELEYKNINGRENMTADELSRYNSRKSEMLKKVLRDSRL